MGVRDLKKELEALEKHAIIHHVIEVYKRYPKAREYFDFFVEPDEDALLEEYKARVHEGFYPERGKKLKLYRSRRALNHFKKLASTPEAVISLHLYFIQVAVMHARESSPSGEAYYTRIEKAFRSVLEMMEKEGLQTEFQAEAEELVDRCAPFPWNCQVHMQTIYDSFYA